jgi:hypothetical protein
MELATNSGITLMLGRGGKPAKALKASCRQLEASTLSVTCPRIKKSTKSYEIAMVTIRRSYHPIKPTTGVFTTVLPGAAPITPERVRSALADTFSSPIGSYKVLCDTDGNNVSISHPIADSERIKASFRSFLYALSDQRGYRRRRHSGRK